MWDLFRAELLRFRGWAIAYAVLHLLVLGFMSRVVDLAQQPLLVYRVFGGVYALTGLLLGLYQLGGYRRPNAWLNLLHRPLSTWRIAIALLGTGVCLLVVAMALPILVIACYQESMTARVVDLRHWLLPLASLLVATCGYLAGAYCMLGGRRYSTCALVFVVLLGLGRATGIMALMLQGLVLLWLAGMVVAVFKPDLTAPPKTVTATVLTALPLMMGAYLVVLLLGVAIEMVWIMQGSYPTNMSTPPHGGAIETERMSDKQRMLAGLAVSDATQASLWREQVALSEVYSVGQLTAGVPVRNELTNTAPMEFEDDERGLRWVFSHDKMRFEGYRLTDGSRVGQRGIGMDNAPFPAPTTAAGSLPVLPEGDRALVAGNVLYQYIGETRRILPRISLPAGEVLTGTTLIGENLAVISNRALYLFDGREVVENEGLLTPRHRIPIPGSVGDLTRVELIELVDGYLLSFSFTWKAYNQVGAPPYQTLLWVDDAGRIKIVARRAISQDYPALYRYKAWWPSPAMYALREGALSLFAETDPLQVTMQPPVPRNMWVLAIALMTLSLIASLWISRRKGLSMAARGVWVLVCGLVGWPALISLWLLYPESEQVEAGARLLPATA